MTVRSAAPTDAERLLEIYRYYVENTAISFEITVPTVDEFRGRIENTLKSNPYLVIEENGVIRGYCYASPLKTREAYRYCRELSVYLDRNARRKGYGRRLYAEMEAVLKAKGVLNLYACIVSPIVEDEYVDRSSERFHARMGFTKIAEFHQCGNKFGRWYNAIWMEKMIGAHETGR